MHSIKGKRVFYANLVKTLIIYFAIYKTLCV